MKNSTSRLRKLSKRAGEKKRQTKTVNREREKQKRKKTKQVLIVFSLLILATAVFGTVASWRSLPANSTSAMPTGTPPPLAADAPSKEFIYAGSALISTVEPFREPPTDLAVWRPSNGTWLILNSQQQTVSQQWGLGTDLTAPGDFDGDGKTDFCVYRPSNGTWYIINSSNSANQYISFGTSEDIPAVADYDGDARSDIAVWRPSNQTWYILQSSNNSMLSVAFGSSGDKPVQIFQAEKQIGLYFKVIMLVG